MLAILSGTGDNIVLRQVHLPIVATSTCNSHEWWDNRISDAMICAGEEDNMKDVCKVCIIHAVATTTGK